MSAATETSAVGLAIHEAGPDAGPAEVLPGPRPRDCAESRRNAYDHGLTAKIAFPPEELELIRLRFEAYKESFRPETPFQLDKCDQAAVGAHRGKRAQLFQAKARQRLQDRTRAEYDEDRRRAARALAEALPKRPAKVAAALRDSVAGCEYLIERWTVLADRLEPEGTWTAERLGEAYDLLGVPAADRLGDASLPLGDRGAMRRRIDAEVAGLRARMAGVLASREDRRYAESREGMGLEEEPEIQLYRRYERDGFRHERRAIAELLADQDRLKAAGSPQGDPAVAPPAVVAAAEAAAPPAPSPQPEPEPAPAAPIPTAEPVSALFPTTVDGSCDERTDAEIEADLDALSERLMAQIVTPPPATGAGSPPEPA